MALDEVARKRLIQIKENVEDILSEISEVIPDELFRKTVVLRYCGPDDDIREFFERDPAVWTDDVSYDIEKEIVRHREIREEA